MKHELNLQLLSSLNVLSYSLNLLCFMFFSRSRWWPSAKPWVTVQSGKCSLLGNFRAAGGLQQLLMKTTVHSQENNCFQESHTKLPVFLEKGTCGKSSSVWHYWQTFSLWTYISQDGCLCCIASGLSGWLDRKLRSSLILTCPCVTFSKLIA